MAHIEPKGSLLIAPDKLTILELLPELLRQSPHFMRNVAMVKSYLDGNSMAMIAKAHGVSGSRVGQISKVGGGIIKGNQQFKERSYSSPMKAE